MSDLARLEAACAGLESLPELDDTADYVGRLNAVIRSLEGHRRMVMSEVSGPQKGEHYRIVEERSAKRSYNTRRLLEDFDNATIGISELVDLDVVRLQWQWTKLRNLAIAEDIGLRIAGHEITEDEADHVGETWVSTLKVEGVK